MAVASFDNGNIDGVFVDVQTDAGCDRIFHDLSPLKKLLKLSS